MHVCDEQEVKLNIAGAQLHSNHFLLWVTRQVERARMGVWQVALLSHYLHASGQWANTTGQAQDLKNASNLSNVILTYALLMHCIQHLHTQG